eukprot:1152836-Pelagomonas_calceolata.AAC.4
MEMARMQRVLAGLVDEKDLQATQIFNIGLSQFEWYHSSCTESPVILHNRLPSDVETYKSIGRASPLMLAPRASYLPT